MTGGLIQLVAYGYSDIFLTRDPQITFFKIVYRRHTNFTKQQIPQFFQTPANFGKTATCTIAKNSDMIGNIVLVVTLPKVKPLSIQNINESLYPSTHKNTFAWVKRIGFSMIKTIEVEINGSLIDRHYGEWLSIWSEITGMFGEDYKHGYNKMIGDVSELTDFTSSKNEYTLYIPFYFWFCRSPGLALPLVALQYSDVKINIEFEDVLNCYMLSPSHYIKCNNPMVGFIPNEYIEQNVNGTINAGIFINYDVANSNLYYYKITDSRIEGIPSTTSSSYLATNYMIVGQTSGFVATPASSCFSFLNENIIDSNLSNIDINNTTSITVNSVSVPKPIIKNLSLTNCFLLVDYYFLDIEERIKISQSKHDYLIEQLFFTPSTLLNGINQSVTLSINQPCKLLIWLTQLDYIRNNGDIYNYTTSYRHKINKTEPFDVKVSDPIGSSLILKELLLFNSTPRLSKRKSNYFTHIQQYQNFKYNTSAGISVYSFGLYPLLLQPTGTCNMSQFDNIQLQFVLSNVVTPNSNAFFRSYALCYNILRIINGLAGLVFTN
jgi:hypothetical protein